MSRIHNEQIIFSSQRFSVVKQDIEHRGVHYEMEQVVMGDGIVLVILNKQGNVYMVREWRSSTNGYIIQLPGGYAGTEDLQRLLMQAQEEALQELGIGDTGSLQRVKSFMPVGGMRGKLHLFFMEGASQNMPQSLESTEDVEIVSMPLIQAYNRFVIGDELTTASTMIGLTFAMNHIQKK